MEISPTKSNPTDGDDYINESLDAARQGEFSYGEVRCGAIGYGLAWQARLGELRRVKVRMVRQVMARFV